MIELAEFENRYPYGDVKYVQFQVLLTDAERKDAIQTCTKTACMRGLETEMEVEWTVYEIGGKNLNLEDIKESTLTIEYPMTKKHFCKKQLQA